MRNNYPDGSQLSISRIHILLTGHVQGVGFRAYVQQKASTRLISGWVRNLGDDTVELTAEGSRDMLDALLADVQKGPPGSRVYETQFTWEQPSGEFNGFRIRFG
jgi:acylphosphatase